MATSTIKRNVRIKSRSGSYLASANGETSFPVTSGLDAIILTVHRYGIWNFAVFDAKNGNYSSSVRSPIPGERDIRVAIVDCQIIIQNNSNDDCIVGICEICGT